VGGGRWEVGTGYRTTGTAAGARGRNCSPLVSEVGLDTGMLA